MTAATRRAIADYAARMVAQAPPLTPERAARLAVLWGLRAPSRGWLDKQSEVAA